MSVNQVHLIAQLKKWQEEGDRLIACLDTNEHIYNKLIGKALTDIEGLVMKEVVGEITHQPTGTTYFRGSMPINRWSMGNLQYLSVQCCNHAAALPLG